MGRVQVYTPYELAVKLGNIPGVTTEEKFGANLDVDAGAEEIVWDGGHNANALPTYSWMSSPAPLYMSSSNAGDTQNVVIDGLQTSNWLKCTCTQALNGQNKVQIENVTDFIRCHRAKIDSAADAAGDIYIYEDDTVVLGIPQTPAKIKAIISQGENQTLMAIYSTAGDEECTLKSWYASVVGQVAGYITARLYVREFGKVFRTRKMLGASSTGSSYWRHPHGYGLTLPPKSDIMVGVISSANNMGTTAGFDTDERKIYI